MTGTGRRRLLAILITAAAISALTVVPSAAVDGQATEPERRWLDGPLFAEHLLSPPVFPVLTRQVTVPVRDGTRLDAVLFQPLGTPAEPARPCVIGPEGYETVGSGTLTELRLADLARRGYAGLYVQMRGSEIDRADGLYPSYGSDGHDVVEWAASQPWCDEVGMIGTSLNGIAVWLTAAELPPHLRAIAPDVACGDCYWYLWHRGGTLPGAGREARKPPATPTDEWAAASAHPTYDPWWDERNTTTADHVRIADAGIAVLECGGWDDYIYAGGMRAVEEITAAGGDGMHLIGPCSHTITVPDQVVGFPEFHAASVAWFDRWLKDVPNGIDELGEAVIQVEGPDRYRAEPTWPPSDTDWTRWYLGPEPSGTIASLNDGTLGAGPTSGATEPAVYRHDPTGPLNDAGGGGPRPTDDQRDDEANSVTWTGPTLAEATEITGWPRLQVWASSSAPDVDFVVELTEVAPDGTSTVVTRGWLNGPQSIDRADPPDLRPKRIYPFVVELWPVSHVVPAGHRLRVAVSGSDSPGTGLNPTPSTVTIFQGRAHPSVLELPVISPS